MRDRADRLAESLLGRAREAVSPSPAELDRAWQGVRARLRAPTPSRQTTPVSTKLGRWRVARGVPLSAAASARWRLLVVTATVAVAAFALGVRFERHRSLEGSPPVEPARPEVPAPAAPAAPAAPVVEAQPALHSPELSSPPSPGLKRTAKPPSQGRARDERLELDEVVARLVRAERARHRSEPALSLALLDEIDARADPRMLRAERLMARVLATCASGDAAAAARVAAELRRSADGAIYTSHLRDTCVGAAEPRPSGAPDGAASIP